MAGRIVGRELGGDLGGGLDLDVSRVLGPGELGEPSHGGLVGEGDTHVGSNLVCVEWSRWYTRTSVLFTCMS